MFRKVFRPRLAAAVLATLLVAPVAASALPLDRPLGGGTTITDLCDDAFAWLGGLLARVFGMSDEGSIIDPNGAQGDGDEGSIIDPNGAEGDGDEGSIIDPNGGQGSGDEGSIIDPNG